MWLSGCNGLLWAVSKVLCCGFLELDKQYSSQYNKCKVPCDIFHILQTGHTLKTVLFLIMVLHLHWV